MSEKINRDQIRQAMTLGKAYPEFVRAYGIHPTVHDPAQRVANALADKEAANPETLFELKNFALTVARVSTLDTSKIKGAIDMILREEKGEKLRNAPVAVIRDLRLRLLSLLPPEGGAQAA